MTVILSPEKNKRAYAIFGACDAALIRLNQSSVSSFGPPIFGPLGEALFWLCAWDELLKDVDPTYQARRNAHADGWVIPGLRWARNQVTHGVNVVEMTGMIPGAQLGLMRLGLSQLGSLNTHRWLIRQVLPPPGPNRPTQQQSYDQRVAGKILQEPLTAARAFLIAEAGLIDPFAQSIP